MEEANAGSQSGKKRNNFEQKDHFLWMLRGGGVPSLIGISCLPQKACCQEGNSRDLLGVKNTVTFPFALYFLIKLNHHLTLPNYPGHSGTPSAPPLPS